MKVFVDTMFGATFSFDLDPRHQVFDIKMSIENCQGIPVSMQTLYFNDQEPVVDHYQLRDYRIVNNSRLLLLLRDDHFNNQMVQQPPYEIQGFVPSMARSDYDQVPPSHASDAFYNQNRFVTNDDLVFQTEQPTLPVNTFGDDPLLSNEAFTGIKSHWPVNTTEPIPNENHMFQTVPTGTFGDFLVGDYLHILTDNIESYWPAGVPEEIFLTEHLTVPSNPTEERINTQDLSLQKLRVIMTQYDKPGSKFLVDVNAGDKVKKLKKELVKIQEKYQLDLPAKGYFLMHKDRTLDDEKSFSMNGVADGDTIEIFLGPDIDDYCCTSKMLS